MKKFLSLLLVAVLMLSVFAGCGGKTEAPAEPAAPATDAPAETEAPAETDAPADKDVTVYFLTKILGNQYQAVVEEGAKKAAEELGVNLVVTGLASEAEVEKQVQQLQDAVSAGADAIVIGPTDSVALAPQVAEAYASGIPIIIVDTMIATDDYSAAYLTDNVSAGKTAAEEMIARLKKQGVSEEEEAQIAVQVGASGSQTIIDRLAGFNEYWEANAPEKWVVLNDDVKVNDGDISKAVGFTQDFLTTYPNIKGVFGPNNGSTVGFVTGLIEADRTDVIMVGFDFSDEIKNMIEQDKFEVATIVQKQYMMGYEGVKAGYDLATGGSVAEKTVDTGVLVVDIDNINSDEVQNIINP